MRWTSARWPKHFPPRWRHWTLTRQLLRGLELLSQGSLNKQIDHEPDIVESTVKTNASAILRKLNVHSRTQAALLAQKVRFSEIESANFAGQGTRTAD